MTADPSQLAYRLSCILQNREQQVTSMLPREGSRSPSMRSDSGSSSSSAKKKKPSGKPGLDAVKQRKWHESIQEQHRLRVLTESASDSALEQAGQAGLTRYSSQWSLDSATTNASLSSLSMSSMSDESALPSGWVCYRTETGRPYYFNEIENQVTWDDPRLKAHQGLYAPRLDGISESSGLGTASWAGSNPSMASSHAMPGRSAVETEFGFPPSSFPNLPSEPMYLEIPAAGASPHPSHAHMHAAAAATAQARTTPPTMSFSGVQYAGPLPSARPPPHPQSGHLAVPHAHSHSHSHTHTHSHAHPHQTQHTQHTQHNGLPLSPHVDPTLALLAAAAPRPSAAPRSSRLSVARVARSPVTTPLAESPSAIHMPSAGTPTAGSPNNSYPGSPQSQRFYSRPPPLNTPSVHMVAPAPGPDSSHHPLQRSFGALQQHPTMGGNSMHMHAPAAAAGAASPYVTDQQLLFDDSARGYALKEPYFDDLASFGSLPDSTSAMMDTGAVDALPSLPLGLDALECDPDGAFGFDTMAADSTTNAGSLPLTSTAFFLSSGPQSPATAVPFPPPGPAGNPLPSGPVFERMYSAPNMSVDVEGVTPSALGLPAFEAPAALSNSHTDALLANTPISPNTLEAILSSPSGLNLLSQRQTGETAWC